MLLFILLFGFSALANAVDKTIIVLGDSLSAGYGIAIERGWVYLLQERLLHQGYSYQVINASISGDTTRGASVRVEKLLHALHPDIVIIELGGNDGLRGLPLDEVSENLETIIEQLIQTNTQVLLIPIQLPPNYGKTYNTKFQDIYQKLADMNDVKLGSFILTDIADKTELMQSDGIHPKAKAQKIMLDNIWPDLESMLDD